MTDGDARAAEPLAAETGEVPDLGEDNRLVLMAVDPYMVFAYWNVTSQRIEAAEALFDQDELEAHVLRFHDTTGIDFDGVNSRSSFDVKIHMEARKWYVRLWSPETRYCADIGLRGRDGRLVALVRSNLVETPAAWPHVRVDEAAALVEQDAPEGQKGRDAAPVAAAQEPARADSRHVLDTRLAEVAELRDEPLTSTPGYRTTDLTEVSERNFSPGISSLSAGARRPGK